MTTSNIEEIRTRLAELKRPSTYIASLSTDNAPQVRPVTLMFDRDHFYFATSRSSNKTKQILRDDRVEFVTPFSEGGFSGYLRVRGRARETTDRDLVERVTTEHRYPVNEYWKGVDDPDFFFFKVMPECVQYMKPGAEREIEVTDEFVE